jgi:large subunit ribosomal protein L41
LGKFRGRKFIYDEQKMDEYMVPELDGFNLKPYVSVHTPKVDKAVLEAIAQLNDFNNLDNFNRY